MNSLWQTFDRSVANLFFRRLTRRTWNFGGFSITRLIQFDLGTVPSKCSRNPETKASNLISRGNGLRTSDPIHGSVSLQNKRTINRSQWIPYSIYFDRSRTVGIDYSKGKTRISLYSYRLQHQCTLTIKMFNHHATLALRKYLLNFLLTDLITAMHWSIRN